eukprot:2340889-Alexandrium_andersonii.AAC.1
MGLLVAGQVFRRTYARAQAVARLPPPQALLMRENSSWSFSRRRQSGGPGGSSPSAEAARA